MTQKDKFLDWLKTGIYHKVLTERAAKKLYVEKYGKIDHLVFLEKLYD